MQAIFSMLFEKYSCAEGPLGGSFPVRISGKVRTTVSTQAAGKRVDQNWNVGSHTSDLASRDSATETLGVNTPIYCYRN